MAPQVDLIEKVTREAEQQARRAAPDGNRADRVKRARADGGGGDGGEEEEEPGESK